MKEKRIAFTGGGTAGHVMVNLALIPHFLEKGWQVDYIGSYDGIERELIQALDGVEYFPISTGKLRRYMSKENFKDPFKVAKGTLQAWNILRKRKPKVIFSKGGFVSVPVVVASRFHRIPTIIHESDLTPGLANRLAAPFVQVMLTTFPETVDYVKKKDVRYIGPIIREELFQGDRLNGERLTNFSQKKPVLLVMGGSSGSQKINENLRKALPELLPRYQIIHLCGKGNVDDTLKQKGYVQFEYVKDELKHLFAITDLVISRAGANAIFELLALQLPMLLIPLSLGASRGDQIDNAQSFHEKGVAHVLEEEALTPHRLVEAIDQLNEEKNTIRERMQAYNYRASRKEVLTLIEQLAKRK